MIRPEHQFDIRPDLRKAASTKAESTTAESVIRPKQLVRVIVCMIDRHYSSYCFLASELSIEKKKNILDRQQIASQWGLQLIFRMHNSHPTPQGVENRNILLWLKCVLTALHVNCMILFDKVL